MFSDRASKQPDQDSKALAFRSVALRAAYVVSGGGGGSLKRKREFHRRLTEVTLEILRRPRAALEFFSENRCPVCSTQPADAERFENQLGLGFTICPTDGAVFMDPVPTEACLAEIYNSPAEAFHYLGDGIEAAAVKPTDRADYLALTSWLGKLAMRPKLLDVGCSKGGFLLTCRESFDVEGVELNAATAEAARRAGLSVHTGLLEQLPGSDRYDVITMLQLIEHVTRPLDLMLQAKRLLKPGGYLYLNTPNVDSLSFRYLREYHVHVRSIGHVSLLTETCLRELARQAGLEVVRYAQCGGKDIALHDILTFALAKRRFVHRMSLYSPRLYHACALIDDLTGELPTRVLLGTGAESYHRALLRKR
jgi:SAM-dependent methyltransferase